MNGFIELNQNELEIIDAGALWGNVLIGGCTVLGAVGGFLGGGVAGAAVGTVTFPIIGTVSGAAAGAWSGTCAGALAGAGTGAALATILGYLINQFLHTANVSYFQLVLAVCDFRKFRYEKEQ